MRRRPRHAALFGLLVLVMGVVWFAAARPARSAGNPLLIVTGAGPGGGPDVGVWTHTGTKLKGFFAYDAGFTGGVHVGSADLDGNGTEELITGAGPGGGPDVRMFNADGTTFHQNFMAYDPAFAGGVYVAGGDLNGDGKDELITGAGPGGGPEVRVFQLTNQGIQEIVGFFPYSPSFKGGVTVGAADIDGDGTDEIITGAGPGGGPHVQAFALDFQTKEIAQVSSFFPYSTAFGGGVFVGGSQNHGPNNNIVTGAGPGGGPHVRVVNGAGQGGGGWFAYGAGFTGGVRVAGGDIIGDGNFNVVTAAGPGGGPHVKTFNAAGGSLGNNSASFFAYGQGFTGGVFVALLHVGSTPSTSSTLPVTLPTLPTTTTTTGSSTTSTTTASSTTSTTACPTAPLCP